ncbi:MAG: glycosyltransferase [Desulfovibrio sp.]|jgi:cellulose synthase/poly-beta-1,6-N-acetylglucosamine synthase-like glycosyltransferase|nr:glycosyltransferase [Desulfovibrio sp.]
MTFVCMAGMLTGIVQCLFLFVLARLGRALPARASDDEAAALTTPDADFPSVALIVPVAGSHPRMEEALTSLVMQNYPCLEPIFVTAADTEDAAALTACLQKQFPQVRRVTAGQQAGCGQKNHNSLCGVKAAGQADVFVFCDSTHPARPDFVRTLVAPIARGEADFTTGYHQVLPRDARPVTLAYAVCVLLMRLLQALAPFTQPWGGAMAIRRAAFERWNIADIWAGNVVDDCSLAGILPSLGARVRLCPGALLNTEAAVHRLPVWLAWMDRQVRFLKFCVPSQWFLLGALCALMALPLVWAAVTLCAALVNTDMGWPVAGVLVYLGMLTAVMNSWRRLVPAPVPLLPWLRAFLCAVGMFAYVYARSVTAKDIVWHGIQYTVGRGGKVSAACRAAR